MGRYDRVYGAKYDTKLSTKEIAVRVREDIKAAIKAGELPKDLKTTVKTAHFSGGSSIDIIIRQIPNSTDLYDFTVDHYGGHLRLSGEVKGWIERLQALLAAYNHDGSDSMTDYFDVRFYGHVRVLSDLERDWREASGISNELIEALHRVGEDVLSGTLHTLVNDPDAQRAIALATKEPDPVSRLVEVIRLFNARKAEAA